MQTTSLALEHLLCAIGDPVTEVNAIGPGHPEFGRAQIIRAGAGVLAKSADALPAITRVLRTAPGVPTSMQTRLHLAAAEAWSSGNPILAAERYASILAKWPHDLLALRLALSSYFFLGWHEQLQELVDATMLAWRRDRPGFRFVLAMASFAHAESGDAAYAERLGRQALAGNPACPLGVHAVAHAIAASGQHGKGAQWMRDQRDHWATESRMCTHNAWHLSMFHAEEGDIVSALAILDAWLLPASSRSALDACDATALLWRLTSDGVDDAERWSKLSDAFERILTPGFWPYVDLHAALAHLTAGNQERVQKLVQSVDRCAEGASYAALRARHVTRPGLLALRAQAEGRYDEAAVAFVGLQPFLGSAGGSRVQLEVFQRIERRAVQRQGVRQPQSLPALER